MKQATTLPNGTSPLYPELQDTSLDHSDCLQKTSKLKRHWSAVEKIPLLVPCNVDIALLTSSMGTGISGVKAKQEENIRMLAESKLNIITWNVSRLYSYIVKFSIKNSA